MYFTIVTTGSRQLVEATRPPRSLEKSPCTYNTRSFSSLAIGLPSRRDLVLSLDSSEIRQEQILSNGNKIGNKMPSGDFTEYHNEC